MIRRSIIAAVAFLGAAMASFGAVAQTGFTFVPLGYCQLTSISAATPLSACSGGIPMGSTRATITVESQPARYRDDGTAPTGLVGMPLAVGQTIIYSGTLSKVQFIESTSGGKVNILFYR